MDASRGLRCPLSLRRVKGTILGSVDSRLLIVNYVFAVRSERTLCRDVQVSLADRWFCGLLIEDKIADRSAFSRVRNERVRNIGIFRSVLDDCGNHRSLVTSFVRLSVTSTTPARCLVCMPRPLFWNTFSIGRFSGRTSAISSLIPASRAS